MRAQCNTSKINNFLYGETENVYRRGMQDMEKMNVWKAIVEMVKAEGVDLVFGIGDTGLQLQAEKASGIRTINLRYEGSAPFMAMAYARLTGRAGVCTASAGPGVALFVPGVLEAYSGCSPVVVIAQSTSRKFEGMGDLQECDQVSMMRPVTKWSARIPYADRIPWFVRRAFSIAMNGQPGPVFLELPYDVTGISKHKSADMTLPNYIPVDKVRCSGDRERIQKAVEMILAAKRPVVVAGNGAMLARAGTQFKEFIELFGIPFLTTPGGRGIVSEMHPLALGMCGIYRTKIGKDVYNNADLIITVGSRNESFQTHEWADFPKGARYIQIDIAPTELGRNWIPDIGIVGDAGLVLEQLTIDMKQSGTPLSDFMELSRIKKIAEAKLEYEKEVSDECTTVDIPVPAKRIVHEVSCVFGDDTIMVSENGSQDTWAYCYPYCTLRDGSEWVPVAEQTCMGMGVVGAIAAKLVRPEKKVVCFAGDAAFQMAMKELPTAAQYKAGCTWIVLNNSAMGWPKHGQIEAIGWDTLSFSVQPDFAKCAEASGCYGRTIMKPTDVRPALEEAIDANSKGIPAVLDFVTGIDMSHLESAV
jgi:acetolactate synthase-1/2/3 large subunit